MPMYFLIGIWGHERRIYAAVKFFLYTMTFLKALNILFFGIPFVAIKWYLRGNK